MAKSKEKSNLKTGIPLWKAQVDFLGLTSPVRGMCSGRNCGKSHVGAVALCLNLRDGERALVVSPDANVIEETTWPLFESIARKTGQWVRGVRSPYHRAYIKTVDGGEATVVFRGAEKPDKLRGGNYALLWFDEASVITHEAYKTAAAAGRWKGKLAPLLMTFTPRGKKHWTFEVFYEPVEDERIMLLPPAHNFEEGHKLPTGETSIQGRWYRTKPNATLVRAKTKDNPFAPEQYVDFLRSQYTSTFAIQELEGLFVDVAGLMFRREWFKFVERVPRRGRRIRYWDLAATEEGGCFTVGTLICRSVDGQFYIEDVRKGQWGAFERNNQILDTARYDARMYNDEVEIYLEQEPGSGGLEQVQQLQRMLAGFPVFRDLPTGGSSWRMVDGLRVAGPAKIIKARQLSAQAQAGNVFIKYASFANALLDELSAFPHSTYLDSVDSAASCFNKLCSRDTGMPGDILLLNQMAPEEPFSETWRRGLHLHQMSKVGAN